MDHAFYFASPYGCRAAAAEAAHDLAAASGWRCTSSWLDPEHADLTHAQQARGDLRDLAQADAMVLWAVRQSTRGGMWVELGFALAQSVPVLLVAPGEVPLPVFCAHDSVLVCDDLPAAAEMLAGAAAASSGCLSSARMILHSAGIEPSASSTRTERVARTIPARGTHGLTYNARTAAAATAARPGDRPHPRA